jgi:hypothetical protein
MTPFEAFEIEQHRTERQDAIAQDLHLEGSADAAFGQLPRLQHPAYLSGYMAKLLELPINAAGEIQYHSPHKQFAFGWVDGSERFSEEF